MDASNNNQPDKRVAYIEGLRVIADALELDSNIPLPYAGSTAEMSIYTRSVAEAVAACELIANPQRSIDPTAAYFKTRYDGKAFGVSVRVYVEDDVAFVGELPQRAMPTLHPTLAALGSEQVPA